MTVPFKEIAGSPLETYGPEGLTAQRVLLCAWDDRGLLVEQILGDGRQFGGRGRAQYPLSADVVAVRAHCEPLGDDIAPQVLTDLTVGLSRYNGFAKVTVDYELLVGTPRADLPAVPLGTFLSYQQDHGVQSLTLPARCLAWQDESSVPVAPDAAPAVRLPLIEHQLTWRRVVSPPWQAIRRQSGTINARVFLGAAAGTVLFEGAAAEAEFLGIDELARAKLGWRIRYVFRERAAQTPAGAAVGWNHAYRSLPVDSPGWDELADTLGNPPYRSSDFCTLFQFEDGSP